MKKLEFSINLAASPKQLLTVAADYENYPSYLPDQIKSVEILQHSNNETIIELIMIFKTILKKEIKQKSRHIISNNQFNTKIISGSAKGTVVNVLYEKIDSGTKVSVDIDLKLSLKARLFSPLIKKLHKLILTGIFYKMNTKALELKMK